MDFDPVAAIMAWIGAYGLAGLFAIALAERFVPVIPSYGLLLAIGIGAADEAWSLPAAFLSTVAGGMFGCAALFYTLRGLGTTRSVRLLNKAGGSSECQSIALSAGLRHSAGTRQRLRSLSSSSRPSGCSLRPSPPFCAEGRVASLVASAAGIAVWNGLFIGIGFYASHTIETGNMTVLALAALGCLLVTEVALFWLARWVRARSRRVRALCQT
jgi:membrane protein DedA with SNARE-associated domain